MPLPPITHLQFVILQAVDRAELPGRDLRQLLEQHGQKTTPAAFYQLMARLEDLKMVSGELKDVPGEQRRFRERWYRLLPCGRQAITDTRDFYADPRGAGSHRRKEAKVYVGLK